MKEQLDALLDSIHIPNREKRAIKKLFEEATATKPKPRKRKDDRA